MAHPYKGHKQDVVGRRRVKVVTRQSGGAVQEKLPTDFRVRSSWERLGQTPSEMQNDHNYMKGRALLKAITTGHPYAESGSGWWAREQGKGALRHSDAVPRGKKEQ